MNLIKGRIGKRYANQVECKNGHLYTKSNTILFKTKDGRVWRRCRICKNAYQRNHYWRKKLEGLDDGGRQLTIEDFLKEAGNDD